MNTNNMARQIFHKIEYDLKGHGRLHDTFSAKFFLAYSIINQF